MTPAYILKNPHEMGSTRYSTPGGALYRIPRLVCEDCGEHGSIAVRYPGFDVYALGGEITGRLWSYDPDAPYRLRASGPSRQTLDEFGELSALLAPLLGPDRPFGPFTELGPARGRAEGLFDDFSWASSNGPLFLRRSVFDEIRDAGFLVTGVAPEARYRRARRDPLIEIETRPTAHVHPDIAVGPCATCGFVSEEPAVTRLDGDRWDCEFPIRCVFENPRVIVIGAALADLVRDRRYTGVALTEIGFE